MRRLHKTILLPTLVVFVAISVVFVMAYIASRNTNEQELSRTTSAYATSTEDAINDRLNIFEETLRAGVGLLSGAPDITRAQWNGFIGTSAVLERYPGAQSVGYAKVVTNQELPAFINDSQTRITPGFRIYPEGQRSSYVPIIFLAPDKESNSQFIGFDIQSDQVRQKALNLAARTGQITISDIVQSLIDKSENGRSFVMYAPQYKQGVPQSTPEQREAAIQGFVYAGFRANTFMQSVIPRDDNPNTSFLIRMGDSKSELYKWDNYDDIVKTDHRTLKRKITVGNTTMDFEYVYKPDKVLPSYVNSRPLAVAIFGALTAFLTAGTVYLVLRDRANQLLLEQERGINEAKDSLISLASHQLRTPATGVKQYVGLLLQGFAGDITKQQRSLLERAFASNERQLKTINDVLYLARLSSGRVMLTKSAFSVNQLVKDILHEQATIIKDKQHKLSAKLPARERKFIGDEHMIRMAIENLINNAVKYTHPGGKIKISVTYGTELKVSVQDNGVGIPEDQHERMFDQFERIDNDLSITVGGTGIGLYVVQNIVNLHGGRIEVRSKPGTGSTFNLYLPYGQEAENAKV
jgi:signal transduction histidine kinase/sensor domain CHASE-containing protein